MALCLYGLRGTAESVSRILWFVRVPRTAAALLCGAALSTAGYLMQEALHNALASPSIMGVNAGAASLPCSPLSSFPLQSARVFVLAFFGGAALDCAGAPDCETGGLQQNGDRALGSRGLRTHGSCGKRHCEFFPNAVADKQAFTLGGFAGVSYAGLAFAAAFILPALLFGLFSRAALASLPSAMRLRRGWDSM